MDYINHFKYSSHCFLRVMVAVDRVGATVQIDADFRAAQAVAESDSEATPGC